MTLCCWRCLLTTDPTQRRNLQLKRERKRIHAEIEKGKSTLSYVATSVLRMRLLHAVAFSKKLLWFESNISSLRTQPNAVNACVKPLVATQLKTPFLSLKAGMSNWRPASRMWPVCMFIAAHNDLFKSLHH